MSSPILTTAAVDKLVSACLYGDERPEEGALIVRGIVRTFGFDRDKVAERVGQVESLIRELPEPFLSSAGGGWSFLNLCVDRHDRQWGEHPTMEALCCVAIAAGRASWLFPRDLWDALPGGVPYIVFEDGNAKAEAA